MICFIPKITLTIHATKNINQEILLKKCRLFIEGKNFDIKSEGKVIKTGFFANRYIEAIDSSSAERIALDLIRKELKGLILNDKSNPPLMFIKENEELLSFEDNNVPGTGFSWFKDADS